MLNRQNIKEAGKNPNYKFTKDVSPNGKEVLRIFGDLPKGFFKKGGMTVIASEWQKSQGLKSHKLIELWNENKTWGWLLNGMDPKKVRDEIAIPMIKWAFSQPKWNKKRSSDASNEILKTIEQLTGEIKGAKDEISPEDAQKVENDLNNFKQYIIDVVGDDDSKFKEIVSLISNTIKLRPEDEQDYSFNNKILINAQRPNHGEVTNRRYWMQMFNRDIKKGVTPIWIREPSGPRREKSSKERDDIKQDALQRAGVSDVKDLPGKYQVGLDAKQLNKVVGTPRDYNWTAVYDESDTFLMKGKEDILARDKENELNANSGQDIEDIFDENQLSDKVKPIYAAAIDYSTSKGLNINHQDIVDDENIHIPNNEGNDVSITTRLIRELILKELSNKSSKTMNKHAQASLGAWIVMRKYGFNIDYLKVNHEIVVGDTPDKIFKLIKNMSEFMSNFLVRFNKLVQKEPTNNMNEVGGGITSVSPEDIADALQIGDLYADLKRQENLTEALRRGVANLR